MGFGIMVTVGPARLTARQNARLRQRVLALAHRQGMSERALAKSSGLSIGAVRSIGATEAGPTLGTLLALGRALRVESLDQLLGPSGTALLMRQDHLASTVGEQAMVTVMGADQEP